MSTEKRIHVAVGVVRNLDGEVLVSLRHSDVHQGGLWEFPGGKVDQGESVRTALCREFEEELGITPTVCFPLTKITHHYSDKAVLLDVWMIHAYEGHPQGLEGQRVDWRPVNSLRYEDFPAANKPIIDAIARPLEIPITPELSNFDELEQLLISWLDRGLNVVYLRQNSLAREAYGQWLNMANQRYANQGLKLLADMSKCDLDHSEKTLGYHAKSQVLMGLTRREVSNECLFSASCHNLQELQKAQSIGVDFVFLSPVHELAKYSNSAALGWDGFSRLVEQVSLPVYALGGVAPKDITQALAHGAVGVSGISAFKN